MKTSFSYPALLLVLASGCAANASAGAKARAASDKDDDNAWGASASASAGTKNSEPAPASAPPPESAPTPEKVVATAEPPPPAYTGNCQMTCFQPLQGPITAQENAAVTQALDGARAAMGRCSGGRPVSATYTLRFNTSGELIDLFVEPYAMESVACVDEVRSSRPTLSLPSRVTVRCQDRCRR